MAEPTISLRRLREWATDSYTPDANARAVLALVEAVEAELKVRSSRGQENEYEADLRLATALARFTEET